MKQWLLLFGLTAYTIAGTPVLDGVFDGESTWGAPVAQADNVAGWSAVDVHNLYVTWDATYAYFCATFNANGAPAPWMRAGFAINVSTGGGPSCPWGEAVTYGYLPADDKPDVVLIARLGDDSNWGELRKWNGTDWNNGAGTNVFPADVIWTVDLNCIESRVLRSDLGGNSLCDVQFYVSGNNTLEHGVFDACPDDQVMTSWNEPTTLDNYSVDVAIGPAAALQASSVQPETYTLYQNYPNPFNPQTIIRYRLAQPAQVIIRVIDVQGKVVQEWRQGLQPAGAYEVLFDGSNLPSGIYFYELVASDFHRQLRMLLLK